MNILITGASGLVGSALKSNLEADGHRIITLVRKASDNENEVLWNPQKEVTQLDKLEGVETVIHLAGENVGEGRWTEEKKKRIRESRVIGTRVLCEALRKLETSPKTFISASAIGIYGNRGDEILSEDSSYGDDFLANVCIEWENASRNLEEIGVRVVHLRFGIILSRNGGALAKMLTPFKLGVGGKLGSGSQYMSWVAIEDVIGAVKFVMNEPIKGAVNVTAPNPVTNIEFTETLGNILSRPTLLPVPEFALKIAFGEMADTALLASQKVFPKILTESGYQFIFPNLKPALKHQLKQ